VDRAAEEGCGDPEHAHWKVVRNGFYGREPRRRQRYRCGNSKDRDDWHRFRPTVVRFEAVEPHCSECESPLSVGEGPNAAHRHDVAAREIAAALADVANGATGWQASLGARRSLFEVTKNYDEAGRPFDERPQAWAERQETIGPGRQCPPLP
jgi:hypothetical protein